MVGDYDDRVEQIIRLTEDLFFREKKSGNDGKSV